MTQQTVDTTQTPPPRTVKRRRLRAVLLGILILVCGMALGAGVTLIYVKKVVESMHTPGDPSKRITKRLERKLDLSPEQAEQVGRILRERERAVRQIFRDVRPRLKEQFALTRDQVAEALTQEQKEKWLKRIDRMERRWIHDSDASKQGGR